MAYIIRKINSVSKDLLKGGTPIKLGPLKINIIKRVFI